jgi:hypothetical protein
MMMWRFAGVMLVAVGAIGCQPSITETRFLNFDPESTPTSALKSGWSYFEKNAAGDTFVWSIARQSTVTVDSLADGDRLIRFRGWPFQWKDAPPQTITVFLNGLNVTTLTVPSEFTISSFVAPKELWKKGPNDLSFQFGHEGSPKEKAPPAQDARTLAFAFDWLEIEPAASRQPQ